MKKKKISRGIVYILALVWVFITLFPLVVTVLCSFKDNEGINLGMFSLPKIWLWSNYSDAFKSANMLKAVFNSFFVAAISTLVVLIIGMLAAYILSRKSLKGLSLIYSLFIVGVMVPVHCTIIPISSMATSLHGKNNYLFLILVYAAFNISQAIFLFTGFMQGVSKELDEAAILDGCNDFQLLFKILFPICIPILTTEAILSFVYGYGELIFSMVLISDKQKYTVSRAMLAFNGGYQMRLGPIFASIIVAVIPMILIYVFFHEKVQSGLLAGSVKG
jgi:raffinose/stachyose/melibiose transport system permease protein